MVASGSAARKPPAMAAAAWAALAVPLKESGATIICMRKSIGVELGEEGDVIEQLREAAIQLAAKFAS